MFVKIGGRLINLNYVTRIDGYIHFEAGESIYIFPSDKDLIESALKKKGLVLDLFDDSSVLIPAVQNKS